jgi:hypothetical protein
VLVYVALHVVEDVFALQYLESFSSPPMTCRDGVMTAGDNFFDARVWHHDSVIRPILSMMEVGGILWTVGSPWSLSIDSITLLQVVLLPVLVGVTDFQRADEWTDET